MRYLYYSDWVNKTDDSTPIFFYAGNEGDIESFYNNTGLMFSWAEEYKALVLFGEHRYYG